MMRTEKVILYISQVPVRRSGVVIPIGLSAIQRQSARNNLRLGITGVLYYQGGHYIQLLEGAVAAIDDLYGKIAVDQRHINPVVLVEQPISSRVYKDWQIKLLARMSEDGRLNHFIEQALLKHWIAREHQHLLDIFKSFGRVETPSLDRTYDAYYSLSKWPDFSLITPSPAMISLCELLLRSPVSFPKLVAANIYGSEEALNEILMQLKSNGVLKVESRGREPAVAVAQASSGVSFFSKMQSFIQRVIS